MTRNPLFCSRFSPTSDRLKWRFSEFGSYVTICNGWTMGFVFGRPSFRSHKALVPLSFHTAKCKIKRSRQRKAVTARPKAYPPGCRDLHVPPFAAPCLYSVSEKKGLTDKRVGSVGRTSFESQSNHLLDIFDGRLVEIRTAHHLPLLLPIPESIKGSHRLDDDSIVVYDDPGRMLPLLQHPGAGSFDLSRHISRLYSSSGDC